MNNEIQFVLYQLPDEEGNGSIVWCRYSYHKQMARTISRTAWGTVIKEDEVEAIIKTIPEIEYVDGKYILQNK